MRFQPIAPTRNAQSVAYDASAQSAALAADTKFVRVMATTDAWIAWGANPTAVASAGGAIFLKGGVPEILGIAGAVKIAAIKATSAGALNISEGVAI